MRLTANYHNITHPSLPNYTAATSGLSYSALPGFLPDGNPGAMCDTPAKNIFGPGETRWSDTAEQLLGLARLGQAASSTAMTKACNL